MIRLFNAEELAFLKANYTLVLGELTRVFNTTFDRDISTEQINGLRKRKGWKTGRTGGFEKGSIPANKGKKMNTGPNKTSFKKGQKPYNWLPIGSIRTTSCGYIQRKMTDTGYPPHDWVEVHRLLWTEHHGPIPDDHFVIFIDGNKTNIAIDNLSLVSRGVNGVLNVLKLRDISPDMKPAGITLGRVIHKLNQSKRAVS